MAEEASRAGARLYYGRKFTGGDADDRGISLPGFSAQYLIGADGARSRVAEAFGLGRNRRFLVGAEIECEPVGEMDHASCIASPTAPSRPAISAGPYPDTAWCRSVSPRSTAASPISRG